MENYQNTSAPFYIKTIKGGLSGTIYNVDECSNYGYFDTENNTFYLQPSLIPRLLTIENFLPSDKGLIIELPTAYYDSTSNDTIIEGLNADGDPYTLEELQSMVDKTFYINPPILNSGLSVSFETGSTLLVEKITYYEKTDNDTTNLPISDSTIDLKEFGNILLSEGAGRRFEHCSILAAKTLEDTVRTTYKLTFKTGIYAGHTCYYWEIEKVANNLFDKNREGYGIKWKHAYKEGHTSPEASEWAITRIGNMEYHKTLPILSRMRRCIRTSTGIIRYVSDEDWTKDTLGNTIDYTAANQDIFVEIPHHYYEAGQIVEGDDTYDYLILYPYVNIGKEVPLHYIGMSHTMIDRDTNYLWSTMKIDPSNLYDNNGDVDYNNLVYTSDAAKYRGGGNDSSYDNEAGSCLGRPATNINITNYCNYAKNRGNGFACLHWESWWTILRLYVVEYANFNSLADYNPNLTIEGYHQGGLGAGATGGNGTTWNTFNSHNPIFPCGVTLRLGNKTGIVKYITPSALSISNNYRNIPSYRGIENPFGSIWHKINGVYIVGVADDKDYIFTADDGWNVRDFVYSSTTSPATGYSLRFTSPLAEGWCADFSWDSNGAPIAKVLGSTEAKCPIKDYYWGLNTGAKTALLGGALADAGRAGLAVLRVIVEVSYAYRSDGARLLYLPQ